MRKNKICDIINFILSVGLIFMLAIVVIVIGVIIDQLSKVLIVNWLSAVPNQTVNIINGIVSFSYHKNTGVSFSFFQNVPSIVLIIAILIVLAIAIVFLIKYYKEGKLFQLSMALIVTGAIGNLIDRIFKTVNIDGVDKGYVVDFIKLDFINFPVFNFADICITVGAALLVLYVLIDIFSGTKGNKLKENDG